MEFIIKEYVTPDGVSYFSLWFDDLNSHAAAKVRVALARLELGNFSNCKLLSAGVWEFKIDYGPGYRIYFAKEDNKIILLLTGGSKKKQQKDIDKAKYLLLEYKKRKGGH